MKRNVLLVFFLLAALPLLFAACGTNSQGDLDNPGEYEISHIHRPVWVLEAEPTCTEDGSQCQVCAECGEVLDRQILPAAGHLPGEWQTDAEPTCTEDGRRYRVCAECGEFLEEEPLFAPGHIEVVDAAIAPTCTEPGSTEGRHCSVCGEVFEAPRVLPATGHTPGEWETDEDPTCTEAGSRHLSCSVCGETLETAGIDPLDHEFGGWGMETEPTCTENGTEKRVCVRCGAIERRDLAAWDHFYGEWETLTEPTCSTTGTKQRVCRRCDDVEIASIPIDPSAHVWNGEVCDLCGEHKPSEGLIFTKLSDGSFAVSGYTGSDTVVYLPSAYQSKPVTAVGAAAFLGQENVTRVILPQSILQISYRAFENCYKLEAVDLPSGLQLIGNSAFQWCKSLETVMIPDSVTEVGEYAFYSCHALKRIHFGKGVAKIGLCSLATCFALESITVAPENPAYHSFGNCLIQTETKELWAGCKNSVLPSDGSVTSIPSCAFYRSYGLTELNIPRSVTLIGASICADCINLTDIYYEGTVEEWGEIWKNANWDSGTGNYTVHCKNGNLPKGT